MRQSAFTILTPVRPEHDAALTNLLIGIGDSVAKDQSLGLSQFELLHYASFSLVTEAGGTWSLLFEGNIDGSPAAFLRQLLDTVGPAMDDIYRHCEGYPQGSGGGRQAALRYLQEHDIGADAFYVAWPGQSVELISREDSLRRHIQDFLDGLEPSRRRRTDPVELHGLIVEEIRGNAGMSWALEDEPAPVLVRHASAVTALVTSPLAVTLLGVLAAAAGHGRSRRPARLALLAAGSGAAAFLARLRLAELADDRRDRTRTPDWQTTYAQWKANLNQFRHREDVLGQNHLASIADIKPGRFRLFVLRTVLLVTKTVATLSPVRGALAGITSIHFARWAITRDRKRLVFLSNFDGSWENYLGDFIDLAAGGLTGVWSNTDNAIGFPRTKWLTQEGARDEARFKAFARYGMVQTLLWYSAYPGLSVANISNNRAIRQGLRQPLDASAAETWLRRL